jgi:hypothetical protein
MYTTPFVVAKVTDIALVTTYYFFFALLFSIALQWLLRLYDELSAVKEKSTWRLMFEVSASIFFIAVAFWIIKNTVERIPFPLEGYGGYTHARLSESALFVIASLTMILFQTSLMDKIRLLNERIFKKTQA